MTYALDYPTWRSCRLRGLLTGYYGPERATKIIAGQDPATERDLAAWRSLGDNKRVSA